MIGKDVNINLIQIQHAMLDQTLNKTEKELEEESGKELLNPKNVLPIGKRYKLWRKDLDNYDLYHNSSKFSEVYM